MTFDPLVLETFWSRLISTVDQQAAALIRTSFTPSVAECGDLSACVFDPRGFMLAQAVTGTPGHINSMARCIGHVLREYPAHTLQPGDVLITNDPWLTSGHHYDVTIITPVFRGADLVAFFGNICHTADIGGRPYGPDAIDTYEEGLNLPILKLFQAGQPNRDLFRIIRSNVRAQEEVIGDLYSQVAGDAVGGQRLLEFMDEYGLESIVPLADELIARSEHAMRDAVVLLPDGVYRYRTTTDGFEAPIELALTITVDGDHLTADYTGTSPQVEQAINVVMNYTEAYTTFGLKCALAPDVPNNEGSFRAVHVTAPEGSVLNCRHPAPTAARHLLGHFLPGMILAALAPVVPQRAMAEGMAGLWSTNVHGLDAAGNRFTLLSFLSGGTGARRDLDGLSSTAFPSGVAGIPTEVFENRSPLVMLERELRQDSGGAGRQRGGLGHRLVYSGMRLNEPYRLSPFTDRVRQPAPGLEGGLAGAVGEFRMLDGTPLHPKRTVVLDPEAMLVISLPGGGGFGSSRERAANLVRDDVLDGLVSAAQAHDVYGVAVLDDGTVDDIETQHLRARA
ncbi:MAG: hydantoinase B/oxoprolinase family protein [Chloroflexota bacterium]|nr:hydantoinase B/oxoprolinase family protein [Chloroflexota bacterium]